jgi:hypothetical protein
MVMYVFACVGLLALFGAILFAWALYCACKYPECFDDEQYPAEFLSHLEAQGDAVKGSSGNSHQRRIARRELARADKLGKA